MPPGACHCSKCDRWLDRDAFGNDKQRKDGRKAWCRECRSAEKRAYYVANKASITEKNAAYERHDRERLNARKRVWRAANRERVRAIDLAWRRRHPDIVLMKNAKRRGATAVEPVSPDALMAKFHGMCGICGEALGDGAVDFDHIVPLSRGGVHTVENLRPAHPKCNRARFNRLERAS